MSDPASPTEPSLDLWLQPVTPAAVAWAEGRAGVLDDEEVGRWKRFHRQASRDLFVLAHVATRFVLSADTSTEPAEWAFERGANGRPEIVDRPNGRRFNISHTEGMVAILTHGIGDAGVDVESPWRSTDITSVSKRVFTETEREAMLALPADEQPGRFYQLWTLKESFIKAKGKGFAMPLSKFGFSIGADGAIGFDCDPSLDPDPSSWSFSTHWAPSGHVVSVGAHHTTTSAAPTTSPPPAAPTLRSLELSP